MRKKCNGYFTIEAAFILPIVLFIYLVIILSAMFLYCRCVISQDEFLLSMRGGRLTLGEEKYGEAIYGSEAEAFGRLKIMCRKDFLPARKVIHFIPRKSAMSDR